MAQPLNLMDWGGVDLIVRSIRQADTPGQQGRPVTLPEADPVSIEDQPTVKTEEPVPAKEPAVKEPAAKEPKAKRSWLG